MARQPDLFDASSIPATSPARPVSLVPITVRIPEACRLTGIGRSKLYELIQSGEIPIVKIGAMTLVPVDSLQALIDRHRPDQ